MSNAPRRPHVAQDMTTHLDRLGNAERIARCNAEAMRQWSEGGPDPADLHARWLERARFDELARERERAEATGNRWLVTSIGREERRRRAETRRWFARRIGGAA